ncbi:MFS transporter [Mucilaginibacter pedocola]|uniref:MFS transporter permease n=1 Tax=Mucilaginibacter pedocola TaxID=1792845 RepID=A0A1S9PGE6_9SPHI|nr:MFS transporter [Mucilaginibacter pedocola]OOQ60031.1 MFS transporter permease [Mucilaginibacter pedocola]
MAVATHKPHLSTTTLWIMTLTTGLVVANLYYNQPLLGDMAQTFHVSNGTAGQVSMLTQIGYAVGMFFVVPMADMVKRKRLMLINFAFIVAALLLTALAPTIHILILSGFLLGCTSIIPQLLVPMAAHLAEPAERGKKIGFIMSGLLIGILLSRTLSGFVGAHLGWRAMFYIAAGMMVVMWLLVYLLLPEVEPDYKGNYGSLMRSLVDLVKNEPKLRLASLRGALCFACFSAFWTTLVFVLKQNFNEGSDVAGAFGLAGALGAVAAGLMGRLSDKMDAYKLSTITLAMVLLSFIIFWFSAYSIAGLIAGVILMDIGVQATHISNQAIIFSLNPAARNRINTVYMVSYFIGGATGTFLATRVWGAYNWAGICAVGIILSAIAIVVHLATRKTMQRTV